MQATPLGAIVETTIRRAGDSESPLGNLFADAMRESILDADVGLTLSNAPGGLRADLLPGPLTFGALYDAFPFDNRFTRVELTAADLSRPSVPSGAEPRSSIAAWVEMVNRY